MSSISGFPTSQPSSTTGPSAFNELTSGQFLQIIFTELANQDPFEPNDSAAMLEQLATIRSIEADTQMSTQLKALVRQNELAAASGLIGSLVSGISMDNRRVADLVISVSQTPDGPVLNLFDGSRMFFSNLDEIVGPLSPPNNPTDPGPTDPGPTDPPIVEPDPVKSVVIDPSHVNIAPGLSGPSATDPPQAIDRPPPRPPARP
jgi:hypothetical protein